MPLQRFDTRSVPRPSGLVPPVVDLTGVTELRLHGVGGTTPRDLLSDEAPQQVSGDRIAGFYRTADLPGRHVEAYSWGGLTSRSGWRVLWLLLFPFALANVAGWMCTPATHRSAGLFRLHRTAVRWAALGVTVNLLLVVATVGMDLMGYQCGGQPACADGSWLLRPLRWPVFAEYPGRRVLIGALLPLALLLLLALLALRTINRYESARPPERTTPDHPMLRRRPAHSAAQPRTGLADPAFWDGQRSALHQGCLHIGSGCAFVALVLAHTVRSATGPAPVPVERDWPRVAILVLGGVTLLGALALAALDACPPATPGTVLATGALAVAGAGWFAAGQPALPQPYGYLPGMRDASTVTLAAVLGALLLVLLVALAGGWRKGQFLAFGPFVALALGVISLNAVLLGTMIRVADLLGRASTRSRLPGGPPRGPELYLSPMNARFLQYLTVLPLALLLLFVGYELISYWRAGTDRRTVAAIRAWYAAHVRPPEGEPKWQQSAVPDEEVQRRRTAQLWRMMSGAGWAAQVARARRLARMPRDVDKPLTVLAGTGVVLLVAIHLRYWVFHALPWGTQWTLTAGSYLGALVPLTMIVVLRRGWSHLSSRRRIGIIWDVTTFWPRAYHPLAPPSYAERAVPELQRRLWRIHDNGGRVVVAAHSQGTVLAAAALLQPESRPDDDMVALVTFGSPLRTLYGWAFPAYFGDPQLRALVPDAGVGGGPDPARAAAEAAVERSGPGRDGGAALYAWRNFYYRTDYIGGAVLAAEPATLTGDPAATDPAPVDAPAAPGPASAPVDTPAALGPASAPEVDVELPDPATNWYIYGQPRPVAARHSGYWTDAAVWRQVDELAEALAGGARLPRQERATGLPDDARPDDAVRPGA